MDKIESTGIKRSITQHIKWLDNSISKIDEQLSEMKKDKKIKEDYNLLTSIPGVGALSAYYLIGYLPEIGKLSNKAIASLVGVAPFNHDSGNSQGKRYIQGGRKSLRQILYMAALSGSQYNSELSCFYQRLQEMKKPGKVAITAVMHKLLSMINSVMKRRTVWKDNYQETLVCC